MIRKTLSFILFFILFSSCMTVKGYESMYLRGENMRISQHPYFDRFEIDFHINREAASGANGGKTGGDCGCN